MRLTTKGRYAVMAMVDLAANSRGQPISLADIAARNDISLSYLEQLFAKLRRGGLVESVRGPGGGYRPARAIGSISVAEVVTAVEDSICCEGGEFPECCAATRELWRGLGHQIHEFLTAISLEDVCERRVAAVKCDASHDVAAE